MDRKAAAAARWRAAAARIRRENAAQKGQLSLEGRRSFRFARDVLEVVQKGLLEHFASLGGARLYAEDFFAIDSGIEAVFRGLLRHFPVSGSVRTPSNREAIRPVVAVVAARVKSSIHQYAEQIWRQLPEAAKRSTPEACVRVLRAACWDYTPRLVLSATEDAYRVASAPTPAHSTRTEVDAESTRTEGPSVSARTAGGGDEESGNGPPSAGGRNRSRALEPPDVLLAFKIASIDTMKRETPQSPTPTALVQQASPGLSGLAALAPPALSPLSAAAAATVPVPPLSSPLGGGGAQPGHVRRGSGSSLAPSPILVPVGSPASGSSRPSPSASGAGLRPPSRNLGASPGSRHSQLFRALVTGGLAGDNSSEGSAPGTGSGLGGLGAKRTMSTNDLASLEAAMQRRQSGDSNVSSGARTPAAQLRGGLLRALGISGRSSRASSGCPTPRTPFGLWAASPATRFAAHQNRLAPHAPVAGNKMPSRVPSMLDLGEAVEAAEMDEAAFPHVSHTSSLPDSIRFPFSLSAQAAGHVSDGDEGADASNPLSPDDTEEGFHDEMQPAGRGYRPRSRSVGRLPFSALFAALHSGEAESPRAAPAAGGPGPAASSPLSVPGARGRSPAQR